MRRAAALLVPLALVASTSHAEDSVALWGNYFKEQSTRVIEPFIRVTKDLPWDANVEATYLVDNITSASTGFTGVSEDRLFEEFRHEVRFGGSIKLFDLVTPGANIRYSVEPDYRSLGWGVDVAVDLFEETTTLKAYFRGQDDAIGSVADPSFEEDLETWVVGASWTQIWRKDLITGLSVEGQLVRGFQENEYRSNETHPLIRDRFTFGGWLSYRFASSGTTAKLAYRAYTDSWDIDAHTIDVSVNQRVLEGHLRVAPRYRFHTQGGAYFSQATLQANNQMFTTDRDDARRSVQTRDPKLEPYHSHMVGLKIQWTMSVLRGSFLETFERSRIEPSYAYLMPSDSYRYGAAHIAELGWYWPF